MKIKDLQAGSVFRFELRGKEKTAGIVKFNGTRAEIMVKGAKAPLNLSVESEILGVVSMGEVVQDKAQSKTTTPKSNAKRTSKTKEDKDV